MKIKKLVLGTLKTFRFIFGWIVEVYVAIFQKPVIYLIDKLELNIKNIEKRNNNGKK